MDKPLPYDKWPDDVREFIAERVKGDITKATIVRGKWERHTRKLYEGGCATDYIHTGMSYNIEIMMGDGAMHILRGTIGER